MKTIKNILAACVLMSSISASANGVETVVKGLKALDGKTGKIIVAYDKDNSGVCRLEAESFEYEDENGNLLKGTSVSLKQTGMYFEPVVHIYANAEEKSGVLTVSTNSNRPGGDACGDSGGAVNYKKQIVLSGNKVGIRETFRCTFEAFKKYDLQTVCQF